MTFRMLVIGPIRTELCPENLNKAKIRTEIKGVRMRIRHVEREKYVSSIKQ